jgi:hypothetical protein
MEGPSQITEAQMWGTPNTSSSDDAQQNKDNHKDRKQDHRESQPPFEWLRYRRDVNRVEQKTNDGPRHETVDNKPNQLRKHWSSPWFLRYLAVRILAFDLTMKETAFGIGRHHLLMLGFLDFLVFINRSILETYGEDFAIMIVSDRIDVR